ncbi:MAG: ftsE [Firmicutes bacterium]|nr:ftsE [Bacillota bacterium]
MPTLQLQNATKVYRLGWRRKLEAVSDINLTIQQGEFVFVVGSSGSGKSTLLGLLGGRITTQRGSAHFDNVNMKYCTPIARSKIRQSIGMVCQQDALLRRLIIRDSLAAATKIGLGRFSSEERIDEKVVKALGVVGLSGAENKYPVELSASERRRAELARAMINSPSILILDELTTNLDEDTGWDLMQVLMEINRRGTTVVMSTQSSSFVNILRRRVITLSDGRIVGDVKRGRYGELKGNFPQL